MDPPSKLGDFFRVVDDFFRKTFRDDSFVFVAVKSKQFSESFPGRQLFFSSPTQVTERDENEDVNTTPPKKMTNYMFFSPRLALNRDGSGTGKVKLTCGLTVPRVCHFQQGLALTTTGVVTVNAKLSGLLEGLDLKGRVSANTIAPAAKDVSLAAVDYQRRDFYTSVAYQRNGFGSSDFLVDCGTKFFNLLVGAGFERQKLSYLEHEDASAQMDVFYAGLGFTGDNWSIGAKMVRANDAWNTARVAFYQRIAHTTMVACGYNFELLDSEAHLSLGFSQGFRLFLPVVFQSRFQDQGSWWNAGTPFVGAVKVESNGVCAATIRAIFNDVVHWAIVVRKNALVENSPMQFGLTISMESG